MKSSSQRTSTINREIAYDGKTAHHRQGAKSEFHAKNPQKANIRPSTASSIFPPLGPSRATSAPSTPRQQHRPRLSKTSSLTSIEVDASVNGLINRRSTYYASGISTPPLSPALRRKLIRTDCIMKGARLQIDDYRHNNRSSIEPTKPSVDANSLEQALEEVKNCRYLRTVDQSNS